MTAHRILVVEDEVLVALDIRRGLQQLGYEVVGTAATAEEALRVAETSRPDLALMDIHIKGALDGIETARRLREEWDVPAVYLTAYADDETLRRARETAPYGFLTKPFRERELRATLEMALYKVGMERRLRASEAQLAATLRSIGDAVLVTDAQGLVSFLNPRAETLTGCSNEESLGCPLAQIVALQVLVAPHSSRDGSSGEDDAGSRTCSQADEDTLAWLLSTLKAGHATATARALLLARDGRARPVECHATPLREAGQDRGVVLVLRDITERIEAERQRQRFAQELERSNRELQEFAFVASHDLQEPLRKIKAFGDRLRAKYGAQLDEGGRDYLDRMQSAATRMGALIDGLLSFSRVTSKSQPFAPVDLNEIAREVLEDLEARLESSGGRVEIGPLPIAQADPTQMRQLLQNLLGNALKFHQPDVPPLVQVSARVLDSRGGESGERCEIWVRDNGIGFEAGDSGEVERIFAPFGRLHGRDAYEGTGMGLAICKRIAEHHGGSITARSVPGQGAAFIVTLPLRREASCDAVPESGAR